MPSIEDKFMTICSNQDFQESIVINWGFIRSKSFVLRFLTIFRSDALSLIMQLQLVELTSWNT